MECFDVIAGGHAVGKGHDFCYEWCFSLVLLWNLYSDTNNMHSINESVLDTTVRFSAIGNMGNL